MHARRPHPNVQYADLMRKCRSFVDTIGKRKSRRDISSPMWQLIIPLLGGTRLQPRGVLKDAPFRPGGSFWPKSIPLWAFAALLALGLAGCGGSTVATRSAQMRFVNAVPNGGTATFSAGGAFYGNEPFGGVSQRRTVSSA